MLGVGINRSFPELNQSYRSRVVGIVDLRCVQHLLHKCELFKGPTEDLWIKGERK